MIVVIILILGVFWFLNKKSTNDYFVVNKGQKLVDDFYLIESLYRNFEIEFKTFQKAWWYFREFPNEYNGTSVINDRWMIKGLEALSVEHDFNWIVAKSLKELLKSNLDYCNKLRKINTNWLWVWCFIYPGLTIISVFKSIKYI